MVVPSEEGPITSDDHPYRTVLAAVDLTSHSFASARLAARIARSHEAELLLITVIPTPEILSTSAEPGSLGIARRLSQINRGTATRHLGEFISELDGSLRARHQVVENPDVACALEKVAREENASLVVVGAHGRSRDPDHPHGVVATRLLDHVTRPLLVFQSGGRPGGARRNGEGGMSGAATVLA
jgi:nucleotide-binding universal stress UspA family protein